MFDVMPDHIRKRHPPSPNGSGEASASDVPSLGALDDIVLPAAPVNYEVMAPEKEARAAVLDNSTLLDEITQKALTRLDEKLDEEWSGDAKEDAVMMDAVRLTLTTQLRVDDSRLKKRQTDTLAELLKRMDEEDVRLMKVVNT